MEYLEICIDVSSHCLKIANATQTRSAYDIFMQCISHYNGVMKIASDYGKIDVETLMAKRIQVVINRFYDLSKDIKHSPKTYDKTLSPFTDTWGVVCAKDKEIIPLSENDEDKIKAFYKVLNNKNMMLMSRMLESGGEKKNNTKKHFSPGFLKLKASG